MPRVAPNFRLFATFEFSKWNDDFETRGHRNRVVGSGRRLRIDLAVECPVMLRPGRSRRSAAGN